jgi:nitroimidazol reductase NimA-like FMN-containing flavoprotein (pyridoxamine 5'-phosphate oxidase superfamily)
MSGNDPVTTLDARFSVPEARPTPWPEARQQLGEAGAYWLSTVRADGRPHVTTLMAVWHGDALYFSTGPTEQKARNLEQNQNVILTTGCNDISSGLDVVVEGRAVRVTDDGQLRVLAAAWEAKYGSEWHFEVHGGAFRHTARTPGGEDEPAYVFEVAPVRAFGFRKDDQAGQTRWRWIGR